MNLTSIARITNLLIKEGCGSIEGFTRTLSSELKWFDVVEPMDEDDRPRHLLVVISWNGSSRFGVYYDDPDIKPDVLKGNFMTNQTYRKKLCIFLRENFKNNRSRYGE